MKKLVFITIINSSTYMDVWNPVAQKLFYKYVQETHFSVGVDALWLDATEPEYQDKKGQRIYLGIGDEYANTFSLMVAKTVYDGLVEKYPNRRVFSLTRSAFTGQQRYGAALWSGDTSSSWDSLRRQISMSINYQLSGIPYWSMDTGGFFRPKNQCSSPGYPHLLIRWFEFAVFTPIFRVHGGHSETESWNYGPRVQDAIVDRAIFRYRLLEYIYLGFWKVETEHYTMQRGRILDFTDDENVVDIPDQFMFGHSFLVAPIYHPGSSRSIYLPKLGSGKWRCFYSGNELEEGHSIELKNMTISSRIPLFVRSSILILGPDGRQHVDDFTAENLLEVRVYDGCDSQFDLLEEDGISADRDRAKTIIFFSWDEQLRTLTIGEAAGVVTRTINVVLVRPGVGVGVDHVAQPDATLAYHGTITRIKLPTASPPEATVY